MQEYNDFALPSMQNLEQMAKAYQKYKEQQQKTVKFKSDDFILFYKSVINFCNGVEYIYSLNSRDKNCLNMFNMAKKLKLQVNSLLVEQNTSYSFEQFVDGKNVLLFLLKHFNQIVKFGVLNFNNKDVLSITLNASLIIENLCSSV